MSSEIKYIYEMRWFSTRESLDSNTLMHFLTEEETRWGHNWTPGCNGSEYCEIVVIEVRKDSEEYRMALERPGRE